MNSLSPELQALVERLVELHGEEGLCPTRTDWTAILRCPVGEPSNILNLLKFKLEVQTPAGSIAGMAAYRRVESGRLLRSAGAST
jgi:hypothetical protein